MDDPAFQVLRVLDEDGGSAPADAITASLGIPRSTVVDAVDRLRALGYTISEPRKDLFQLTKRSGRLLPYRDPEAPRDEVHRPADEVPRDHGIHDLDRPGPRLQAGPEKLDGMMVIAEEQTGGQGRLGRAWASPPGGIWTTTHPRPEDAHRPGLHGDHGGRHRGRPRDPEGPSTSGP